MKFYELKSKYGAVLAAITIFISGVNAYADDNTTYDVEDLYELEQVEVRHKIEDSQIGKTEIPREIIKSLPIGNGNITDLLRIAPGVQFDENYRSSATGGEIAPAGISISGGKTYDNLFLIDGIRNSSLLDPGSDNPNLAADVPGHPQKFFVDTWLVEDFTLYDSNVPASFDGFTGGVVDVATRRPGNKFGGSLSYRTTRSEWTEIYVDRNESASFANSGDQNRQPNFEKNFFSIALDVPVTERTGFLVNYKRNESTIPLKYFDGWKEQERLSESFFIKGVHNIDGSSYIDAVFSTSPYENRYFIKHTKDSQYIIEGGGYFTAVNYYNEKNDQKFKLHADYSYAENNRRAPNIFRAWMASDEKKWGLPTDTTTNDMTLSPEGGWGNIDKSEESFNLALDHTLKEFEFLGNHLVSYGLSYTHTKGEFNRKTDAIVYNGFVQSNEVICNGNSFICVDGEQYLSRRQVTPATYVTAEINEVSAYLEDSWTIDKFNLRAGIRVTNDDFMNNTNFAPRLQLQYDIFGNNNTVFLVGYNRYYSGNLLANKLREGRAPSFVETNHTWLNVIQDWSGSSDGVKTSYNYQELNTPYKDEYVAGVTQGLFGGALNIKYIERIGKDEFAKQRNEVSSDGIIYHTLNNNGESEYRSVQVKWQRAWKNHNLMMNATWQESTTSNDNYDDNFDLEDMEKFVIYKGSKIKVSEMPKDNFNRPVVLNLAYTGRFFEQLVLSSAVKYRTAYKQIELIDSNYFTGYTEVNQWGETVNITANAYDETEVDPSLTVDLSLAWEQPIFRDHKITFSVEIYNIFNEKNRVGKSNSSSGVNSYETYEMGRQFWAGVSYDF
jgi:beta-galactosidase beta subunit